VIEQLEALLETDGAVSGTVGNVHERRALLP